MADLVAAGRQVLSDVFGKLPEDKRAQAQALFEDPAAEGAIAELGNGALRRSDHSKQLDELAAQRARLAAHEKNLNDWYATSKSLLDLGTAAKSSGWEPGRTTSTDGTTTHTTEIPPDVVRRADFEKSLDERERGILNFSLAVDQLRESHRAMFGEGLDLTPLLKDPRVGEIGIQGVYRALFAERITTKQKEQEDARIQKRVDEQLAIERRQAAHRPVAPVAGSAPSPLDALQPANPNDKPGLVDEASVLYDSLVAKRA